MKTLHYTNCPACNSAKIKQVLIARDHTVSGEAFPIMECDNCKLRFTQDVPDAANIGPYYKSEDYISHTDTAKGFVNKLYRSVRKRTLRNKRKLIEKLTGLQKGVLLDIGAGTGAFLNEMKQGGWDVTGLEPDQGARQVAMKTYRLQLTPIVEFYQLPEKKYDVITLWHVLEHVHDLHPYIDHLKRLLKDNGTLLIAVPNYTSKDATIYKEYWAAYDVPRHLYHFSPNSMKVLLESHGFRIEKMEPMWYDSFYISLLSTKYRDGETNLISAGWNGMRSNLRAIGDKKRCSSVIYIVKNA